MKRSSQFLTISLLFIFTFVNNNLFAQKLYQEIGFRAKGLQNIDLVYKFGNNPNKLIRLRLFQTNLRFSSRDGVEQTKASLGLALGVEKRKRIGSNLYFAYGLNPSLYGKTNLVEKTYSVQIVPKIGYLLGVQYNIFDNLKVGIETIPSLSTSFSLYNKKLYSNFPIFAEFDVNTVALSLVYSFEKDKKR